MSLTRKTKILSYPAEEVLEVEAPVEVVLQQVTNIEYLADEGYRGEISFGVLTDYDGNNYRFQWDQRSKRMIRLTGKEVNKLTWDLCNDVLNKYYVKKEVPKVEEPILPKVEAAIQGAIATLSTEIKNLSPKINTPPPTTTQTQQTQQIVSRPPLEQVTQEGAIQTDVDDFDISVNAATFLQKAQGEDLGIDYMSL